MHGGPLETPAREIGLELEPCVGLIGRALEMGVHTGDIRPGQGHADAREAVQSSDLQRISGPIREVLE